MSVTSYSEWNEFVSQNPQTHLLQSGEWGELKSKFGWITVRIKSGNCGAQILFRKTPVGFTIGYLPKGPVGNNWQDIWPEVEEICKKNHAIVLKVEPDSWENDAIDLSSLLPGFTDGSKPIQPRRTVMISLEGSEQDWLGRMKQKTRYNINLSERKGVVVNNSTDLEKFEQMMRITGTRDGFGVHSLDYYKRVFELFSRSGKCVLLEAGFENKILAMIMVFAFGSRGYYLYGASGDEERNRMPTYLIQWEAMRWCSRNGCSEYDLWGIPDEDEETLEKEFEHHSDGLWGVYRFKRGFGGKICRAAGTWEKVFYPNLYRIFKLIDRNG